MSSYVENLKNQMKKRAQEESDNFKRSSKDFADHPLLYIALFISGMLSLFAGVAIGLGVRVDAGTVTAKVNAPNIFAAVLYGASFPIFFEYALANWLKKYLMREPGNRTQEWTAAAMIVLTFLGTCITAYSASDVIATAFGFFSSFQEIPQSVQKWIAYALPTMLMINVAAGEMYRQFSQEAVLRRQAEMDLREVQVDADMEVRLAQMDAQKSIAIHAAKTYTERARAEADTIGQNRGDNKWQKDRETYLPTPANTPRQQPTPPAPIANAQPAGAVFSAEVEDHLADFQNGQG